MLNKAARTSMNANSAPNVNLTNSAIISAEVFVVSIVTKHARSVTMKVQKIASNALMGTCAPDVNYFK